MNDELSALETDFSLNDEVLAFDQPNLPMNLNLSPQDRSGLLLEGVKSSDLVSSDDDVSGSFEVADFSSSELFPALGKSRMKRCGESAECRIPASMPFTGAIPPFDPAIDPFGVLLNKVTLDLNQHSDCKALAFGLLEVGFVTQELEHCLRHVRSR